MKILLIGSGGREHALAWKIAQSKNVKHIYVAPGNAGTANEAKCENIDIDVLDIKKLLQFAKQQSIDLTIVGPEAPLAAGIVDQFQEEKLRCFGPTQAAAQLESSKSFSKDFMQRHHIPTAEYQSFTDIESAKNYIKTHATPIVIKADGLAAGKGVVIAKTVQEAFQTIDDMLANNILGEAGSRVVIEEFLEGEEASFIVITDGKNITPFASSQDHKARDNGDTGPNTGGMGAYSPAPVVTKALEARIMGKIIKPTINGMQQDGIPYCGFLYAGVMITKNGDPKVLEYNCRFGDPETQPIMMRLKSDFLALCNAALDRKLKNYTLDWDERCALGVVLAAGGYPGHYQKGDVITGLNHEPANTKIFHAGTKQQNNNIVTNGGRVLCVTSLANSVREAQREVYSMIKNIRWENVYYRTDIGYKAIKK